MSLKVAVIGAGGIGGYIGGRLAESNNDVIFVARGAHLEAINKDGLKIESPLGNAHLTKIKATDDIGSLGVVDVILVTVKMTDLDGVASQFKPLIGPETKIVTLQNGIDAKPVIGSHVGESIIAQGVIYLAAYIKEPGVVMTPGGKHAMFVDDLNGDLTMVKFFKAIDDSIAIDVTPVSDSDKIVWGKFTAQASIAAITSITRLNLGGVFASSEATQLLRVLLAEAIAVAQAKGIKLDANHAENVIDLYSKQPSAQSSSLLVDIVAGKPTELEWLSGRVQQLGQELNIPTPTHKVVWSALSPHKDGPAKVLG